MVEEKFGRLKIRGQFRLRRALDDAPAGKTDHGAGLGQDQIAHGGKAGHDAGHGGIGQDADIRKLVAGVIGEGAAGFGHLQ